ncbi:acetyltransferase [Nocardioides humilatus]|uniref:Acetyltransferase n=2 Tax=Nocardioides humilatus TaxID=2607660 RepID=A0A5B1LBJ3_9ACTN|nr:acetyltransferase [Nocardioides humilatus]
MRRADLADVLRWRQASHVAKWFPSAEAVSMETIEIRYGPRIDGEAATRMFVVEAEGSPVGFLQDYRIRDHPEFAVLAPDPDAVGVDYAIGEVDWLRRGIGLRMLDTWSREAPRAYPDATMLFAAPDHRNLASRRLLVNAGFVEGVWFDEPQADGSIATLVGHSRAVASVLG